MLIAYYRVSTRRQGRSGLGLEAQQAAVEDYARRAGLSLAAAHTEVESGRVRDRPQLAAALARCRAEGGTLVVAKLDRLARDVALILSLVDSGVPIRFLDLPEMSADPVVGRLVLTMLAAIAEFEARRIAQRTRDGLARRRARMLDGDAAAYRARVLPIARELLAGGRTLAQAAAALNQRGVPTRKGRPWRLANLEVFLAGRNWRTPRPEEGPVSPAAAPAPRCH